MTIDIEPIIERYQRGESVPQIARQIGVSPWTIYPAMRRAGAQRREPATSNTLRFQASPLSFTKKMNLSALETRLYVTGLMLYWAEGSKRGMKTVDLANSDPIMIQVFLRFLRSIYQVQESRFRILLYCYSNQSIPELITFWANLSGVPAEQFTKPYVREDWRPSKAGRMPHGMIHVRYNDQRLLAQLKQDMEDLTNQLL